MKKLLFIFAFLASFLIGQAATVTDVIKATDLKATSTSYTAFSNLKFNSDAVYAGRTAKDNSGNIQLRSKNSDSGIFTTVSGGTIKSVTITYGSGSNTVDIYGKNTPYEKVGDLYASSAATQGTKIGSLSGTGTVTVTGDYKYIGIRSYNGALYLKDISIEWEEGSTPDPTTCEAPVFSPVLDTEVEAGTAVTVSCPTDGAKLFITVTGDNTDISETEATFPYTFTVTEDVMVEGYAYINNDVSSDVVEGIYTVKAVVPTCADPVFSVASGEVLAGTEVTVSCPTADAVIYDLTINGETISDAEGKYEYTFTVDKEMTVKVTYMLDDNETLSEEATATYTVKKPTCADPVFSVLPGEVEAGTEVTVSCPTANATIAELDINGVAVDAAEGQKTYTFTVDKEMTVSVCYILPHGETMSNVVEAKYTVKTVTPEPVGEEQWVKTAITDLQTGDVVIIVDTNSNFALNPNGDKSSPSATSVTLNADKSQITDGAIANMEFTITVNGSQYQFTHDVTNKLYTDDTNTGVRVGTGSNNWFTFENNRLKNTATNRYVVKYTQGTDWRSYKTATTNNSTNTSFYKKVIKGDDPTTCKEPVFTPALDAEVEAGTEVTVTCPTAGAKLNIMVVGATTDIMEEAAQLPYTFTVTEDVEVVAYAYISDEVKSQAVDGNYRVKAVVPVEKVKYTLVESADDLEIGAEYIMAYVSGTSAVVMGPYFGSKYYTAVKGFTVADNAITVTSESGVLPFVIEDGTATDTYAFKYADGDAYKYITCTNGSSNGNLGSSADKVANANLTFSWPATGTTIGMVWANNSNNNKNKFQYLSTSGQERFTNYSTGGQKDCSLFKKVVVPEACDAPVFKPELGSELIAGTNVTVTCPTAGAKLYITVTGNDTHVSADAAKMPYTFSVAENVSVEAYAYFNDEVKSETVKGEYTVKNTVEGTFAYVDDFAGLNVGDQVVFVGNFGGEYPVSMSSERADGDDVYPAAKKVELSEDGTLITSELTNATIFTIDAIGTDAEGRETYAFKSNVASKEPLYLQYGGRTFLDVKPLADNSEYYFTAVKKDAYPVAQLYATSSLKAGETNRLIRSNSDIDWRAYQENATDLEYGRYTKIYKKESEDVEKAAVPTFSVENGEVTEGTKVTVRTATKGARLQVKIGDNITDQATPYTFTVNADIEVVATAYLVDASGKKILASESEPAYASYTIMRLPVFAIATDIEPGYDYIIVGKTSNKFGLMGAISGKYIAEVEVAGNAEMNDDKFVITSDNVARVRFEPAENGKYYVHYKQGDTDGYLATVYNTASSAKNEVAIVADKENAESATVSVGANGRGFIKYDVNSTTSGEFGHNGSTNPHRFTFYKNANNYDIYLYKCVDGTSPVTYYRSRTLLEDVDYVLVGANDAGHHVMTGYDGEAKTFGSTHEKKNGDVTLGGNGYHLTITDPQVAVVNFVKKDAAQNGVRKAGAEGGAETVWAMKLKDGQHIARGENGQAELSDTPDHVTLKIVEGKDGYMAYLVHGDGDAAQNFQFDGTGFNSSNEAATPIYVYATTVPVENTAVTFADAAPSTVTLTTGYDADRSPIRQTFASVNMPKGEDDFIYIYYDGLATLDHAKNMSDDQLTWRYKYNDSDWSRAAAAQEQTSKVALHVEAEMLGDEKGENLSYKKADPNNPGDWTNTDYIKYSGVNQVYMADTDQPYIKIPAISKYSIVTATATGDGNTHLGDAAAEPRVYVRADDNGTTAIDAIVTDATDETRYYNLQGVRVYNPGSGIYIRVQGRTATKVNIVR